MSRSRVESASNTHPLVPRQHFETTREFFPGHSCVRRGRGRKIKRSGWSCCPSSGRAAGACRACRSAGAAARRSKSTERGHFRWARCSRQNAISSCSTIGRRGCTSGIGCTTAFTSSPRSSLGTPNTAASTTLGWVIRRFSHLLRVDVHAARDDHEGRAVGEVEVAVVVDVADVADRAHRAVARARLGGLLRVVEVLERRRRLEPHVPGVPGGSSLHRPRRARAACPTSTRPTVPRARATPASCRR